MVKGVGIPRLVIAGTHSGAGKTSVAVGLMAAFRKAGLTVQPFKVGPDYLDPGYHALATGRPSWPLDSWMLGREGVLASFARGSRGADIAIIEGMMGLYDGASATDESGSTAEVAKLLHAPVLLVIDAAGLARSAGALVRGYRDFDPAVNLAGAIANRANGEGHLQYLRCAIEEAGIPLVGWLPEEKRLRLPERHLGLAPAGEEVSSAETVDRLGEHATRQLDLPRLRAIARTAAPLPEPAHRYSTPQKGQSVRIAIAQDRAFCFYYPDNLALLEAMGAELKPFSPIEDAALPPGIQGLYLGGGYPELHAEQLSANRGMIRSIRQAVLQGLPTFAECGGFMYLCETLVLHGGQGCPMAGVIAGRTVMEDRLQSIGYREVALSQDTVLGSRGARARGHEFRWSRYEGTIPSGQAALTVDGQEAGYATGTLLASYIHLHFGSNSRLAEEFLARCRTAVAV